MASSGEWVTRGFDAFRRGTFGNAGQNLYVSRAGVLQRIHLFDLNRDGWIDLFFCNSQNFMECPPAYVCHDVLGKVRRVELRSDGSPTGAVGDLNGDGLHDLVLGMESNGVRRDLNACVYYSSPDGLSERYQAQLPAPLCTSCAIGDFNGDGLPDLAFVCNGKLRIFYQNRLGFEPLRFVDTGIDALDVGAADLDGDGFADLYLFRLNLPPVILWGGPDGINPARCTELSDWASAAASTEPEKTSAEEKRTAVRPLPQVIRLGKVPHLFNPGRAEAALVSVRPDRTFGDAIRFKCANALSAAVGDVNGDGFDDLAFACRREADGKGESRIYWGGPDGFAEARSTGLPGDYACDVAIGDLDGDGCAEVALCVNQTELSHSAESLIYRGTKKGIDPRPVALATEGARRVFIARTADDPRPQVIFVNHRSGLSRGATDPAIYWGAADGFTPERKSRVSGLGASGAQACDINDDGWPDLLVSNSAENAMDLDRGSYVFFGGPKGFPHEPSLILPTRNAMAMVIGDINRDGYLEAIFSAFSTPDILVFAGGPNGFDIEHPQRIRIEDEGEPYVEGRRMCLADFNNDGWLDLVVTDATRDRCFVLWGGPQGFSFERRQTLSVVHASTPVAADLTGSGRLDLIIGGHKPSMTGPHDSFVYIFWNGPDGLSPDRRTQLPANCANAIAVADFNNDGIMDIFAGSYTNSRDRDIDSYIYWGGPRGVYSPERRTRIRTHSASGCIAADFNEDGWVDLAICNHKTFGHHVCDSYVLWNGPEGFDVKRATRLPTIGSHGMMLVQPGNQADRGPEEYYTSEPCELPSGAVARTISWQGDCPAKTWVRAQVRVAATRDALAMAPWQGPTLGGWFNSGDSVAQSTQRGRWIQYRLALGATNSGDTPRITEVRLAYE